MKIRPPSNSAFSLVEIALAIGVISFAVVGLLGLIAVTQGSIREGADRTDNSLIFQKVINQLKMKPFEKEQLPSSTDPSILPLPALIRTTPGEDLSHEPFLLNDKHEYVGPAESEEARSQATKVVRVVILPPPDLKLAGMEKPAVPDVVPEGTTPPVQLTFVRVEISGPAVAYNGEANVKSAPDRQVFQAEFSAIDQ